MANMLVFLYFISGENNTEINTWVFKLINYQLGVNF